MRRVRHVADYLERTRVSLVTHGIVDPYLERLAGASRRKDAATAPIEAHVPETVRTRSLEDAKP